MTTVVEIISDIQEFGSISFLEINDKIHAIKFDLRKFETFRASSIN